MAEKSPGMLGDEEVSAMNLGIAVATETGLIGVAVDDCRRVAELAYLHFFQLTLTGKLLSPAFMFTVSNNTKSYPALIHFYFFLKLKNQNKKPPLAQVIFGRSILFVYFVSFG